MTPSKLVSFSLDAPTVLPMNDTIDELYATIFVATYCSEISCMVDKPRSRESVVPVEIFCIA